MTRLLARGRPSAPALALLIVGALAFGLAGFEHARLWHRGYAEVDWVGPLFFLNALGTLVVLLLLIADRVLLFILGVLAISLGSIVSILISHNSSFAGFAEGGWDTTAKLIFVSEIVSVVLVLAAIPLGALRHRHAEPAVATGSVAAR